MLYLVCISPWQQWPLIPELLVTVLYSAVQVSIATVAGATKDTILAGSSYLSSPHISRATIAGVTMETRLAGCSTVSSPGRAGLHPHPGPLHSVSWCREWPRCLQSRAVSM